MVVGAILAGGYGKRLRPLTDELPKPLIEIKNNYTILDKQLYTFKYAGINSVYLLVGYKGELIEERYGKKFFGVNLEYLYEDKPKGTLYSLINLYEKTSDDFVLMNGDIVTDVNIKDMITFSNYRNSLLTIFVRKMRSPYGVVTFDSHNKITDFKEKPELDIFINGGVYFVSNKLQKYVNEDYVENNIENTFFNNVIKNENRVFAYFDDVFWRSVDSFKDLDAVRSEYQNKIDKPWGYEKIIVSNEKYLVKELYIKKGYTTSTHYHNFKDETMHIMSGVGKILFNNKEIQIKKGSIIRIKPKEIHRIVPTESSLLLYEYSTPHLDDTIRVDDPYGRN